MRFNKYHKHIIRLALNIIESDRALFNTINLDPSTREAYQDLKTEASTPSLKDPPERRTTVTQRRVTITRPQPEPVMPTKPKETWLSLILKKCLHEEKK